MNGLEKLLKDEENRLLSIQKKVDKRLAKAPEGTLRITKSGNKPQYMLCKDGTLQSKRTGKYIRKSEMELVKKLAQKAYDKKISRLVENRIKQLQKLSDEYRDDEILKIYESLGDARKELVVPVEPTWEQIVDNWKEIPYEGKPFSVDVPEIYSKRGERVRSKSEKIIADTFFDMGIEYKYECPILLKGYGTVYPDFTIMSRKTGKEIYWEHEGRMDDPKYAESAVRKIDSYMKNGIIPGDNLILTYETSTFVLNDYSIEMMIERYIL